MKTPISGSIAWRCRLIRAWDQKVYFRNFNVDEIFQDSTKKNIATNSNNLIHMHRSTEFFMGFSIPHLLVVLAIVMLVFGTKRLRNLGGDLGGAIKGFRTAMKEGEDEKLDGNQLCQTISDAVSSANTEKE